MTNLNEKRKEQLSALFDNQQALENRHLGDELEHATERYSLIGDVMRNQNNDLIQIDIAEQVASALENEETYAINESDVSHNTNQNTQTADTFNWKKPFAQLAVAASVAMVAIVGIQTMPQQDVDLAPTEAQLPSIQTIPFGGTATPVSYSSQPALETAQKGLRELENQRLGALLMEHQRQSRLAQAKQDTTDETEKQQ